MDPLPGLVGFTAALRTAGLPCDAQRVQAYLAAVEQLDPAEPGQLYWAGRLTLCAEPDDLPRYDEAFGAWFAARPPRAARTSPVRRVRTSVLAALDEAPPGDAGTGSEPTPLRVAASDTEVLRRRDIAELSGPEREHLRELLGALRLDPPLRRSLRHRPQRTGRLDPNRLLRIMRAAGGEPVRLAYRGRGRRPRRLVLLVDVSGSMTPYADALLRFAHALCRRAPASTEVFTVGTRLTRLSRQLRQRDPEQALTSAARVVPDFAGGTRLGETLRAFLDRWGQRGVARRAVVVLFSDGWERGDAGLLGEQMARLRRLAHRVLWVNPHAGRDGYAPVQSGIVAALPHVDRLLAGHSLATLEHLLEEVRRA
ncbi:MAG TPA: VWA domain-containing protein [Actinophytocola sp.]|uniref:vWA domain-containing protein n=1 Tax=Actinophytocola sp. TaxID=1872138 RepID=UPI002DBD9F0B|nr:VWA domain-containing protein [Actinophytocola sp.]HEU5471698.1 VWA domain-containing protein [Actinophytocola sp.]